MSERKTAAGRPDRIGTYLKENTGLLVLIAVTGVLYNVGMAAGPWFEGQLAQYLYDILEGSRTAAQIARLALAYVLVIAFVQFCRFLKRLYVRKFANNMVASMKANVYHNLIHEPTADLVRADAGSAMTKAISDVEACTEGVRKFTTEIFDTGVVMVVYIVMLAHYDWRLTLLCMIFPPVAYGIAARLKKAVTTAQKKARTAQEQLNNAVIDSTSHAVTYRVYGREEARADDFEACLSDYERKNVIAGIFQNATQPVYLAISSVGVIPILYFGGRNVLGNGWTSWTIASFSTFLACFLKLSTKASKSAKLFNAVQKAEVSWKRIQPVLSRVPQEQEHEIPESGRLAVDHLSFGYGAEEPILSDVSFSADPGQIVGITGPVASGKTALGAAFLGEYPYSGSIRLDGVELAELYSEGRMPVSYAGHHPELSSGSVADNICLGEADAGRLEKVLREAEIYEEVQTFENGVDTMIGSGGMRLSGGQQARIALARSLYHARPLLILDDPFSAVDIGTEKKILANLRQYESSRIILLISHRLNIFPQLDKVLLISGGRVTESTHEALLEGSPMYGELYHLQTGGEDHA